MILTKQKFENWEVYFINDKLAENMSFVGLGLGQKETQKSVELILELGGG